MVRVVASYMLDAEDAVGAFQAQEKVLQYSCHHHLMAESDS